MKIILMTFSISNLIFYLQEHYIQEVPPVCCSLRRYIMIYQTIAFTFFVKYNESTIHFETEFGVNEVKRLL
jgi:ABC-type uncharacterized transport system permease subunit